MINVYRLFLQLVFSVTSLIHACVWILALQVIIVIKNEAIRSLTKGELNPKLYIPSTMNDQYRWGEWCCKVSLGRGATWYCWCHWATLMPVYHCHKPVLWSKWPLASSLLHTIKTCRQACPPGYLMHFS